MIKKINIFILIMFSVIFGLNSSTLAQSSFEDAIKTCENFKMEGAASYQSVTFNILITLSKQKDMCIYKEKIFQDKKYQLLTCKFDKNQMQYISESMKKYNNLFEKQIAKNPIFSAKLTSNGEIFNKILVNPKYCEITYSKSRL